MLTVLSLGAGVQSSTIALLVKHGELPMIDAAIFADTGGEPAAVYDWLAYLTPLLPFPVHVVSRGSLAEEIGAKRKTGKFRKVPIPAFVFVKGKSGGLLNRSCTQDYKIRPIRKKLREILGLHRKRSPSTPVACQWIGVSTDEAHRASPSREPWIVNAHPLLDLGMSRVDCLAWLRKHGYPTPPKSSCVFCPFHGKDQWALLTPSEVNEAERIDNLLRVHPAEEYRTRGVLFLHRSGKPIREAIGTTSPDGFGNECSGVCGV